ncbi:uncharacterized protein NECHADRAFT_101813 [Fusarium vanettenii 77-13-4]|uniref:Uncharacterized protein n=1 Tax=Fusarium vanettenii (strain ATCC MYA-4622 / CBS 123669 / FGSC 9596 / NRRL 45880 / 77-13-4) TaxID=660122 RepID=C7ZPC7_FUSV7|nr:uncharacterized protein NECHADRAFT_101813 [Fusarium vanettenii 77-13-4]EEU34119.1 hypothetical protein NECHADRAFT_101813 [Fusarium vanettenii 77-13-4]
MTVRGIHKFYEPAVLLNALNFTEREAAPPGDFDATIDTTDPRQLFQAFVYKLGHICDSVKGNYGATITSFCVLKDEEKDEAAHYWFTSNQRTREDLETTAEYVRELLGKVGDPDEDLASLKRGLLSDVLWFNRPRLEYYFRQMSDRATKCRGSCLDTDDDEVVHLGTRAIKLLEQLCRSPEGKIIAERAREGRKYGVPSQKCWPDLQHMINRTTAYSESVRFILAAKVRWPGLFDKFKVSFIESSQRMERPFRNKSQTADGIVGRMTRKQKMIDTFREFARDLQRFNLDELIMGVWKDPNFRPIVHAEVLLLDHLDKKGLLEPRFFFNEWMYIGSSKPTCKLCHHYFTLHHVSNVGHRPSHGNLYLHWRFPDVLKSQGETGIQRRQIMVDRVLGEVRKEAFDIVSRKGTSSYKGDDSFTYSAAMPDRSTVAGSVVDLGDLASMIGHMDLSDRAGDFD